MNNYFKHETLKILLADMHSMHSKNCDLVDALGQNGLEKQAVEKRSSRIVLLASCVTTITARADCDDKEAGLS